MWIHRQIHPAARRRLTIFLFIIACIIALIFTPLFWQSGLIFLLRWQAAHQGLKLEIGSAEGGLFDGVIFHNITVRSNPTDLSKNLQKSPPTNDSTDLRIERAEFTINNDLLPLWHTDLGSAFNSTPSPLPWFRKVTLSNIEGNFSVSYLHSLWSENPSNDGYAFSNPLREWFFSKLIPLNFHLNDSDSKTLVVESSKDTAVKLSGFHLDINTNQLGFLYVSHLDILGPNGFEKTFSSVHGSTQWHHPTLTLSHLIVSPNIEISQATLDGSQLKQHRLVGDLTIQALGGEIRGQLAAFETQPELIELQAAGFFQHVEISKLTKLLSINDASSGELRAGQFSFRGNLKQLAQATGSIRAEADNFEWGKRRWQRLLIAATIVSKHVAIHELELIQNHNRLSLNGEFPLIQSNIQWHDPISCRLEAHIDDLQSFYELLNLALPLPKLTGQVQVIGNVQSQGSGLNGSVDIAGENLAVDDLTIRQLSTKLEFQDDTVQITDFYATHQNDVFKGQGDLKLDGSYAYNGSATVDINELSHYASLYTTLSGGQHLPVTGSLHTHWAGSGRPTESDHLLKHEGAFSNRFTHLSASRKETTFDKNDRSYDRQLAVAFARPLSAFVKGKYNAKAISFQSLAFKEESSRTKLDSEWAFHFQGVIPTPANWNLKSFATLLQSDNALKGNLSLTALPARFALLLSLDSTLQEASGQLDGSLSFDGNFKALQINGTLQLSKGAFRWNSLAKDTGSHLVPLPFSVLNGNACEAKFLFNNDQLQIAYCKGSLSSHGSTFDVTGSTNWKSFPLNYHLNLNCQKAELTHDQNSHSFGNIDLSIDFDKEKTPLPLLYGTVQVLAGGEFYHSLSVKPQLESQVQPQPEPEKNVTASKDTNIFDLLYPLDSSLTKDFLKQFSVDVSVSTLPQTDIALIANSKNIGSMKIDLELKSLKKIRQSVLLGKISFYHSKLSLATSNTISMDMIDGSSMYVDPPKDNEPQTHNSLSSEVWLGASQSINLTNSSDHKSSKSNRKSTSPGSAQLHINWSGASSNAIATYFSQPQTLFSSKDLEAYFCHGIALPAISTSSNLTSDTSSSSVVAPLPTSVNSAASTPATHWQFYWQ